jgi:DNA-binding beta-propeller fold protein YncE/DNA-binding winged helix-turn-helix (wHTH) protein
VNKKVTTPSEVWLYRFGPYEVDLNSHELRKFGIRVKLERKPFQLLIALLRRAGEVATYSELQKSLWGEDLFVDFAKGLTVAVTKVRAALSDSVTSPSYIETVSGAGYRFVACVEKVTEPHSRFWDLQEKIDDLTVNGSTTQGVMEGFSSALNDQATTEARRSGPFSLTTFQVMSGGLRSLSVAVVVVAVVVGFLVVKSKRGGYLRRAHSQTIAAQVRRYVYVTDYSESALRSYSVNPANGSLEAGINSTFRSGEHPYLAVLSPDRDFLYVVNRGRADGACGAGCNVSGYAVDAITGALVELEGSPYPAGSGPVAVAIHPSNEFVYVANVISNDLYVYARDAKGDLKKIAYRQVGTHPFFVNVTPSGRLLYVSNQDDGTVSAFKLDKGGGELTPVPGSPFATGLRPRYITVDPEGRFAYVINYGVNPLPTREAACIGTYGNARGRGCTISVFKIDQNTGALSDIPGSPFESDGVNPVAAAIDAEGKYLLVTNMTSDNVSVYEVNRATGAIRRVRNSPFATDNGPTSIALDWSDDFVYVANEYSRTITQFTIAHDGRLNLNTRVTSGSGPIDVVAQRGSD